MRSVKSFTLHRLHMIFYFIVVAIFVGASIYFFFRAESLQRSLNKAKRDVSSAEKNHKLLQEALALTAKKNEEAFKYRLEKIKSDKEDNPAIVTIMPLVDNYAGIFIECLKGKGRLKGVAKKCFDTNHNKAFNEFMVFLNAQDKSLQRFWGSDSLSGFISLMEALILKLESEASSTD